MQFTLQREVLLKSLQHVIGVIERRQTLPVLANFLIEVNAEKVCFTGTDLLVEIQALSEASDTEPGRITAPARKLFDIVRSLPDGTTVKSVQDGDRLRIQAGNGRFTLATLPADDFPKLDDVDVVDRVVLPQQTIKTLMDQTAFAMANQDVRYYLNGMLLELDAESLRCVATDGHRLALAQTRLSTGAAAQRQIIIARKGVTELIGLLDGEGEDVELQFGSHHIRVNRGDITFTSKLIDGHFPDYAAVIPIGADQILKASRNDLRMALQRTAILSNEKYRGVKLDLSPGQLRIVAHNAEQEEAVESLVVDTNVEKLSVGFNVGYLLDALASLTDEEVQLSFRDAQSSCLIEAAGESPDTARHVVMPLRL